MRQTRNRQQRICRQGKSSGVKILKMVQMLGTAT